MSSVYLPVSYGYEAERVATERRRHADARLRLLIVDDEPLARASLSELCGRSDDLQVVGEAGSGSAAIRAAGALRPDVLLLDVELPDMTGFDVLRAVHAGRGPLGIMLGTRAADSATARAAGAVDCLFKPVSADRFARSMQRARERQAQTAGQAHSRPPPLQEPFQDAARPVPAFLIGEREHRWYPLDPLKIDYIESDGNYVTLRTAAAEYISRDSIKRLAAALTSCGFIRIERSLLVSVRAIAYAEPAGRGTFTFTLSSGRCLRSSATYREAILRVLPLVQRARHRAGG